MHPSVRRSFLLAFVLASSTLLTAQSTLTVPSPAYPTITSAIGAAVAGDTVLVAPGTYFETIDFLGKAITVRSVVGAAMTTIDGNGVGPVVQFVTNEPPTAVLEGFTIRGGVGATVAGVRSTAGGIQVVNSSPTIRRCVITANQGGVGAPSSSPTLQFAGSGGPGGILATGSALQLIDCEVHTNVGGVGGAGVGGLFGNSGARGGAGGAYFGFTLAGTTPELLGCTFRNNTGGLGGFASTGSAFGGRGGDGGFELFTAGAARLSQCVVTGNVGGDGATTVGTGGHGGHGGFDLGAPSALAVAPVLMRNCVVTGNTGGNAGTPGNVHGGDGAGATGATAFTAISVTIAGNVGGQPQPLGSVTGGLTVGGFMVSSAALRNCIVWGNTKSGVPSDLYASGIVASAQACDLGAVAGTVTGPANFSADPLFVNLAAGDVHLTAGSPCRHAGLGVVDLPLFDFEGDPRMIGPGTDVGADEYEVLSGTREDFTLMVALLGGVPPAVSPVAAPAGTLVLVSMRSPAGAFTNDFAVLLLEPWVPPVSPVGPLAWPGLQVPLGSGWFAVRPAGVGPVGTTLGAAIPPGLSGLAARVQAVAITTAAKNGFFAATAARDLIF
ncbi:MAG: hypothetical protein WAT39_07870 [Planctomycetota bacterium]